VPLATLRPAVVLAVVTLLVWTTRIRNIWSDESLDTAGRIGRTALALAFTAFALAVLATWWRARRTGAAPASTRNLVRAFAVWTVGVWIVRAVQIATADHEAAFVAVHTVLAVASIALALWADRVAQAEHRPAVAR
jgi:hypothetical protein